MVKLNGKVALAALAMVAAAWANQPPLTPDPAKTPGDVLTTDASLVCEKGYSSAVRNVPPALKREVYRLYGIEKKPGEDWEVDHLISLELGGSNSIRNLWPQAGFTTPWNYHVKDRLENALHHLVCHGELPLPVVQRAIARDWIRTFQIVCGNPLVASRSEHREGCMNFRYGARYPRFFHLSLEARRSLFELGRYK